MGALFKYTTGTLATVATAELNSLTNGSLALASAYDNTTNGWFWGDIEAAFQFGANAPAPFVSIDCFLLESTDGTNYASTGGPPPNALVGSWVLASATAQTATLRGVQLPPSKFQLYIRNSAGATLSAASSVIKILPYGITGV